MAKAGQPKKLPELPRRVKIQGRWYKVRVARNLQKTREDGDWGDSNALSRLIRVSNKAQLEERWRILWHEFVHMVLAQGGVSELLGTKTEEAVVLALEHAWEDVLALAASMSRPRVPNIPKSKKVTPPEGE